MSSVPNDYLFQQFVWILGQLGEIYATIGRYLAVNSDIYLENTVDLKHEIFFSNFSL